MQTVVTDDLIYAQSTNAEYLCTSVKCEQRLNFTYLYIHYVPAFTYIVLEYDYTSEI